MKLNPYVRIMQAAERGVGVRLTAEDVYYLAQDDAIVSVATNTLDGTAVDGGGYNVTKRGFEPKT